MLHRRRFKRQEIDEIRVLLTELRGVDRGEQKAIRNRLRRRYGFYISDYDRSGLGFTAGDLDLYVSQGAIEVY